MSSSSALQIPSFPSTRPISPAYPSLLHDRAHPLNVLCIFPSITRGFRPIGSLSGPSPPSRRVSLLNDKHNAGIRQTEQERLSMRKEMTAALVDSASSLSPGRRSSITTLMPTSGSYIDESRVGGTGKAERPVGDVGVASPDQGSATTVPSSPKPPIPRRRTGGQDSTSSSQARIPAMMAQGPSTITSPTPPPAFGSRSKKPDSSSMRESNPLVAGNGRSRSGSPRYIARQRPQTSQVASGSISSFGIKSMKGKGPESDTDSDHLGTTTASGSIRGGGKMSASSVSMGNSWSGNGRPGWEGEEIVNVLRQDGIQVTTLRSASQIGPHLRTIAAMPSSSTSSTSSNVLATGTASPVPIQVVLVPLSDSPTLPSLSLLLSQGTTPSAVCFQQDLLDRARRTEADWLPSALDMIEVSANPVASGHASHTAFVIAYSANPALSESVVVRCMQAGAIGVLQPPYEAADTVNRIDKLIRRNMRIIKDTNQDVANRSRTSVAVPTSLSQVEEDDPNSTIAPPVETTANSHTAHANETQDDPSNPSIPPLSRLPSTPTLAKQRRESSPYRGSSSVSPTTLSGLPLNVAGPLSGNLDLLNYEFDPRRRSVDTGGLALAIERASKELYAMQDSNSATQDGSSATLKRPVLMTRASMSAQGTEASKNGSKDSGDRLERGIFNATSNSSAERAGLVPVSKVIGIDDDKDGNDTVLAELLGEMYRQTKLAIEITMADYPTFAAPLEPNHRQRLLVQLSSWHFKPHVLDEGDLFRCACILFDAILRIDGLAQLGIPRDQMSRFLFAVRAIYHAPNPYHNYIHAIDVLQASYTFLVSIGVAPPFSFLQEDGVEPWIRPELPEEEDSPDANARRRILDMMRPQEVLCLMIAAMGHDVGHPGLSNAFMKNAKTPLSQLYDDQSVLEKMHCTLIVQLMRKHGFSFLLDTQSAQSHHSEPTNSTGLPATFPNTPSTMAPLPRDIAPGAITDWRGFRKALYATIVATDMSLHFCWIKEFRLLGKRVRETTAELAEEPQDDIPTEEDDRIMVCQAIIKCADISNPTRPIDVSEHWSSVLLEEWAIQANLEERLALPVSVISSADAALQARGQIGFIDLFTAPLFEAAAEAMPAMQYYYTQCSNNRSLWQARLEAGQAASGGESPQSAVRAVRLPIEMSEDERFKTIFPLSLPASLLSPVGSLGRQPRKASGEVSPRSTSPGLSGSPSTVSSPRARADPASQAVRAAYKSSIKRQPSANQLERRKLNAMAPTIGVS